MPLQIPLSVPQVESVRFTQQVDQRHRSAGGVIASTGNLDGPAKPRMVGDVGHFS